jgi:mono/diheme cytochrome c family protein
MKIDTSGAQQHEVAEAGKIPYRQYCAVCHGLDGRGKGHMAKLLKVQPADLTQLSAKHEGFFPFWDVYRAIDGRKEIWGHGPRDMPIWGTVFKQEDGPDLGAELQAHARMRASLPGTVFHFNKEVYTLKRVSDQWLIDELPIEDEIIPGGKNRH